jgi:hypothetical protein
MSHVVAVPPGHTHVEAPCPSIQRGVTSSYPAHTSAPSVWHAGPKAACGAVARTQFSAHRETRSQFQLTEPRSAVVQVQTFSLHTLPAPASSPYSSPYSSNSFSPAELPLIVYPTSQCAQFSPFIRHASPDAASPPEHVQIYAAASQVAPARKVSCTVMQQAVCDTFCCTPLVTLKQYHTTPQ